MRRWRSNVPAVLAIGFFAIAPAFAGEILPLPGDQDKRWNLISLPSTGAPIEKEGAELMNAPVYVTTTKRPTVLLRSLADARWARMAAQHMHMELSYASVTLFYPDPAALPLRVKKTTQEL